MTTAWNSVPNSTALARAYAGTEAYAGVAVTPTYRIYAALELNKRRSLADRQEYAGTLFGDYTPVFGPWEIDGTLQGPLTYEDLAIYPRYSLEGGGTGVTDGESTPGYVYTRRPDPDGLDIDSATMETGTPNMPMTAAGVIFPEFTIRADVDDAEAAWQWSSPVRATSSDFDTATTGTATGGTTTTVVSTGAGWSVNAFAGAYVRMTGGATTANIGQFREIVSNTSDTLTLAQAMPSAVANTDTFSIGGTFTSGISDRTREIIAGPGTELYIDTAGGTIGTSQIVGRFISFEVTYQSGISSFKRFMENADSFTARPDLGTRRVTGQVRLEFDRLDEYNAFANATGQMIRIYQEGSVIDSGAGTNKYAQIDVYNAIWSEFTKDSRNNNITATFGFRGFVDESEGVPFELEVKNTLATLP